MPPRRKKRKVLQVPQATVTTNIQEQHIRQNTQCSRITEIVRQINKNGETVQTIEKENTRELMLVQQEEITRELSIARSAYVSNRHNEFRRILDNWYNKNTLRRKFHIDRCELFTQGFGGDFVPVHRHATLNSLLAEQQLYLQFSVEHYREQYNLDINLIPSSHHFITKEDPPIIINTIFGSRFLITAIDTVLDRRRVKQQKSKILQLLYNEELTHLSSQNNMIKEVSRGVFRAVTDPIFPFSLSDNKASMIVNPVGVDECQKYIETAFRSNGLDQSLLIPALEQALMTVLMVRPRMESMRFPLPELTDITQVKLRRFDEFVFHTSECWGDVTTDSDYFAECEFYITINKEGIFFQNVWIQMSLLIQCTEYTRAANKAFNNMIINPECARLNNITDPHELLREHPKFPEFKELQRCCNNLQSVITREAKLSELQQVRNQLKMYVNEVQHIL